jgi:hypothetical protein
MRLILALCLFASPAVAQEALAFNGYSVTISGRPDTGSAGLPTAGDDATALAERICASVSKKAEFASAEMTDGSYAKMFFLCL